MGCPVGFTNAVSREDLALKPNQRLILVHPTEGYLPFVVETRTPFYLVYEGLLTQAGVTTLAANATASSLQFLDGINRDKIEIKTREFLYHLFMGMSPPSLKVYFEYPKGTNQRTPDNQNFSPTSRYGFVDGWASPFDDPSPAGEIFLPWGRNTTGWTFHNPLTLAMTQPLLKFVGYEYKVRVIRDIDLVAAVLAERSGFAARKAPLGGLAGFPYDPREPYNADWVPFAWDRSDLVTALSTVPLRG